MPKLFLKSVAALLFSFVILGWFLIHKQVISWPETKDKLIELSVIFIPAIVIIFGIRKLGRNDEPNL